MLLSLHVKNLALIEEAEVYFDKGLNILTGETGAGKSIIIGSINLALGGKVTKELIRENADYAMVELVFLLEHERQRKIMEELELYVEEDRIIMQRKLINGRSVAKINGETVTAATLKAVSEVLIDIHGQHEHQSLLYPKKQLDILDEYCGEILESIKEQLKSSYQAYIKAKDKLATADIDESRRLKEISLGEFEVEEIENAKLVENEDEQLEQLYRKMDNSKSIAQAMRSIYASTGYEDSGAAGESIGRSLRELKSIVQHDTQLEEFCGQLKEVEGLLNDFNRAVADYMSEITFSEKDFAETEDRLNLINHLKKKYGRTVSDILCYQQIQSRKLDELRNYEAYLAELQRETKAAETILLNLSVKASKIRRKNAEILSKKMKQALVDLNFLDVEFHIEVTELPDKYSSNGYNEAIFMISTNPGEKLKALSSVASGGELSRIMLALKTVLADKDEIGTLIFDEIDAGISGRTAQKVSEKLALIGKNHQAICITHLPQIAAMADCHFEISKRVSQGETHTYIRKLKEKETTEELARLLGGAKITETVRQNAKEMKDLAAVAKKC